MIRRVHIRDEAPRGGYVVHLARHHPTGYGVRSLCGIAFDEGDYEFDTAAMYGTLCGRCKKLDK